jgi:hypothetical protein
VVINIVFMISWALQLRDEERKMRKLWVKEEIAKWDREIERLEGLLRERREAWVVKRKGLMDG